MYISFLKELYNDYDASFSFTKSIKNHNFMKTRPRLKSLDRCLL